MARHYYLTRSGRLRRKDNTLCFEPTAAEDSAPSDDGASVLEGVQQPEEAPPACEIGTGVEYGMGDLALEPEVAGNGAEALQAIESVREEESAKPVRVGERRTIPVEDVYALWVFGELELNARVLVFLAQHKVPVHFFNYYGFYSGTFYPREYLHAGYLVVRQVREEALRENEHARER